MATDHSRYNNIINLAQRRSIFYPASEIYESAPAGLWNYGPYGLAIRERIVQLWRRFLVRQEGMIEVSGSEIMPEAVFRSSEHLSSFSDPMTQCRKCNSLHRANSLLEEEVGGHYPEAMPVEKLTALIRENGLRCPKCKGELSDVRRFNMMIKTEVGAAGGTNCYLRPETCQSIFVDFARMVKTMRLKLPCGIAQAGRAFRNEISPRQSLIRQVEFLQMEAEIFFDPRDEDSIPNFDDVSNTKVNVLMRGSERIEQITALDLWRTGVVSRRLIAYFMARVQGLYRMYGFSDSDVRFREADKEERPFYAKETWDFEANTSLGWIELIANNYRTDHDLKTHMQGSGQDMLMVRGDMSKFIPHVWEISAGVDRTFFAILDKAFCRDDKRTYLRLMPRLTPIDVAVFPLLSNKNELKERARALYKSLLDHGLEAFYDESGSIGRRYARVDEIGCPLAITVDFESLEKKDVTLRERDSTRQERVSIERIDEEVRSRLWACRPPT